MSACILKNLSKLVNFNFNVVFLILKMEEKETFWEYHALLSQERQCKPNAKKICPVY